MSSGIKVRTETHTERTGRDWEDGWRHLDPIYWPYQAQSTVQSTENIQKGKMPPYYRKLTCEQVGYMAEALAAGTKEKRKFSTRELAEWYANDLDSDGKIKKSRTEHGRPYKKASWTYVGKNDKDITRDLRGSKHSPDVDMSTDINTTPRHYLLKGKLMYRDPEYLAQRTTDDGLREEIDRLKSEASVKTKRQTPTKAKKTG